MQRSLLVTNASNLAYGHSFRRHCRCLVAVEYSGMESGTIRRVLHGVLVLHAEHILGAAYVLTFDDYERFLSLMHLMFATFAFLCIGFAGI